jgi:hypothetical protein
MRLFRSGANLVVSILDMILAKECIRLMGLNARGLSLGQFNHKTQVIWKGERTSYTIVQHSPSCVRVMTVGAACSRSGVVVPADSADANDGGIRAAKNYVTGGIESKTSALVSC